MNQEVFSVYDAAAKCFLDPFFAPTLEVAMRGFKEAVQAPDHQFNRFPEDYSLYHIGTFSAERGHIESIEPHKLMMAQSALAISETAN